MHLFQQDFRQCTYIQLYTMKAPVHNENFEDVDSPMIVDIRASPFQAFAGRLAVATCAF